MRRPSVPLLAGTALIGAVTLLAIVGAALYPIPTGPTDAPALTPPSPQHWLGTDDLGRDVLAGVLHGARVSLIVGVVAALTSSLIGVAVGIVSGYRGGLVDDLLMRLTELVQTVPRFFLAVLIAAVFGPSFLGLTLILGLTFWPQTARLLRSQVFSLREREFVLAARALGGSDGWIMRTHVLPNCVTIAVTSGALQVGAAILVEAGLSFLGVGDRGVVSWGRMLNDAQPFLRIAWWTSVFPGVALAATVLGANLFADGLYRLWDPRARRR